MSTPPHSHDEAQGKGSCCGGKPSPVLDPVCGMQVDPATTTHHAEHLDAEYHFCSAGCREKFVANPGHYAPSANSEAGKGSG